MRLILVSGQPGAGKTTVSKLLLRELKNSAYVEVDALVAVNPFQYNSELISLAMENAVLLVNNFSNHGYENVILSGLVKNQRELDDFVKRLNSDVDILFVWLKADAATRRARKENRMRDSADKGYNFDFVDSLIPEVGPLELRSGKYVCIEASQKSLESIVEEMMLNI